MSLAQLLDHVQHFLLGQDALAFQQFHQRRGLPHVGDGEFFEGDKVVGVERFGQVVNILKTQWAGRGACARRLAERGPHLHERDDHVVARGQSDNTKSNVKSGSYIIIRRDEYYLGYVS